MHNTVKDDPRVRYLKVTPRLPVADLQRTIRFYSDMLGFRAFPPWPVEAPTFVILDRDGTSLQFYTDPAADKAPTGLGTIYFDVADARALHETFAGRVGVEWGPEVYWYGRREFAIRDPDGYMLIFSQKTSEPPTCRDE
jgi:catechol 2,3-dioxygenase-like lactoylglutathione lyase family enzyme